MKHVSTLHVFEKNPELAVAWDGALGRNSQLRGVLGPWVGPLSCVKHRYVMWVLNSDDLPSHYNIYVYNVTFTRNIETVSVTNVIGELSSVFEKDRTVLLTLWRSSSPDYFPVCLELGDEVLSQEWLLWDGAIL